MFEINYTNHKKMFSETVRCVKAIEGIQEFVKFQNQLYDMSEDWVYFGDEQIDSLAYTTKDDAASIGFDDSFIYHELTLTPTERRLQAEQHDRDIAIEPFNIWRNKTNKIEY